MDTTSHSQDDAADAAGAAPQSSTEEARRILEQVRRSSRIPGVSVAVAGPEGLLYAAAAGYADLASQREATVDDQYLWFSMTKIATASAAMRLHADGGLDLDAPIGTYLPGYRGHARHGHPTTRQLLSHTAGLGNPLPVRWVRPEGQPADTRQLERIVRKHGTPRKAVGRRASYSNIGYLLAADVMQSATGRPVEDCVRDAVLEPLGMDRTGYGYQAAARRSVGYVRLNAALAPALRWALPAGIVGDRVDGHTALRPFLVSGAGYGGLVGSVTDAAKLAAAHSAGRSDVHRLLSHGDLERMRAITATGKRFDHGIGWFRKPADAERAPAFVEHYGTGGGYWNAMRVYPDLRLAMVAMANTTHAWDVDGLFTRMGELPWR